MGSVHRVHPHGRARRGPVTPLAERNFISRADTSNQHHADAKLIGDYHQLGHQLQPAQPGSGWAATTWGSRRSPPVGFHNLVVAFELRFHG